MARDPFQLPRTPLSELIEDLRDGAEDTASDLEGILAQETTEGQAAQSLEEMAEALTQIAAGAPDPKETARKALLFDGPLHPIGDAADTVRKLLKPRRGP